MKKFLTLTIIAIIALIGLTVSVNAAEMNAEAFLADIADGKMSEDVTLTEQIAFRESTTLDLNGKTLTIAKNANIYVLKGEVTIKNGTVNAESWAFLVTATKGETATLNIESDVNVTAVECAVYIANEGSTLNTAGNLKTTGTKNSTISGVGNEGQGGVTVNIKGGSVTHATGAAVYFPNTKALNISGGKITGATAVYHKSGELNITGGELIGTGAKADYVYKKSGCKETGDALVIEACNYPGGVPVVSITGGIFTSQYNKAIGYYQQTEEYKLANEKFITGGAFSSDISEYVPAGYVINEVYTYDVDMYEVTENRPYVTGGYLEGDSDEPEMIMGEEFELEFEKIFEKEKDNNKTLKEALDAGKLVNIDIQVEKLEEKDINEEELKAIKETAKDGKFIKFYDITLAMTAKGTNGTEDLGTISEISNKLTFKVLIPEELVKEDRTFFMYRYHDGKVEKLAGELDKDNYLTFETNKFSTYALAYEDKVDETTADGQGTVEQQPAKGEKDETPKTGSVDMIVLVSAIVAVISVAGIVTVKKYTR